jgi:Zn-dependent M28 family amino/carboxypeptidase
MNNLEDRLRLHVERLAAEIGERNFLRYDALKRAADYIIDELKGYGYECELHEYEFNGDSYRNIIVEIMGRVEPENIVLVGAHYDSVVDSPGADDNASGVAAILELAHLLLDYRPHRTIRMVAFVNEEPPFFKSESMGSMVYAKRCRERGERIEAMISLEMIGYYTFKKGSQDYPPLLSPFFPDRGDFIAVVGNRDSKALVKKVVNGLKSGSTVGVESIAAPFFIPGIDLSDHASFWRYGYKGVMVTDTAFYRNPNYHKGDDLPDTLDYGSLKETVRGLYNVLVSLGGEGKR